MGTAPFQPIDSRDIMVSYLYLGIVCVHVHTHYLLGVALLLAS